MITTLNALIEYTNYLGAKLPSLKDEIVLQPPGINQSEYAKIKSSLPDFPENYLKCIQMLDFMGVSIGYFRLWPRTTKAFDLVECIVQINTSERNPFLPALREKGLCEVAAWEAEPICVATKKSAYLEGTVVKISRAQASVKGVFLANNFETFLLIAGNLDSIRDKHSNTGDTISALAEFERCLDYFALSPEGISAWKSISEVVLSH